MEVWMSQKNILIVIKTLMILLSNCAFLNQTFAAQSISKKEEIEWAKDFADNPDPESIKNIMDDFQKSSKNLCEISFKTGLPIYYWFFNQKSNKSETLRKWANSKNKKKVSDIFSLEQDMRSIAVQYHDVNIIRAIRIKSIENDNRHLAFMLNGMGNAQTEDCLIAGSNHILYFLKYYSSNQSTVVDIGSGWGGCSKPLALLGYKVYSVDLYKGHLEYQKEHFCDMPTKQSFLYNLWEKTNPELLIDKNFVEHCRLARENIHFIEGDMSNPATLSKIKSHHWNIVLALNSFQFMDSGKRDRILKAVNTKLAKEGSFVLKMNHDYRRGKVPTYDFSLEDMYDKYFPAYTIINVEEDDKNRLSSFTLVKP